MVDTPTVGVPNASPSVGPLAINPPAEAFGGQVLGKALGETGAVIGQGADLLEKRAMQVQAINNQNTADKGTQDWAAGAAQDSEKYKTDLSAALSANPGLDTTAYLGQFLKDQESKRMAASAAMPNVMAQQIFNSDSRRLALMTGRGLAEQTASAWRTATENTAKSSITLNQGIAIAGGGDVSNPAVGGALVAINTQIEKLAALHGASGDSITAMKQAAVSPIYEGLFKQSVDSGDLPGARKILADHAGHDLTPDALIQMNGMLKVANAQNAINDPILQIQNNQTPSVPANGGVPTSGRGFIRAFVLPHEGSQTVTDSNGAPVQYGINKAYNPDLPVGSLTAEQATAALQQRYTVPPGLSPAMSNAYLDTKIMSGGEADKLLAASGGDVDKFIDLREQFQAGLARSNPEKYGKYAETWQRRSEDLREFVGSQSAGNTFGEPPPRFAPNAEPGVVRDSLIEYGNRAATALFPESSTQQEAFRQKMDAYASLKAREQDNQQLSLYNQATTYLHQGLPNGNAVHAITDIPASLIGGMSASYLNRLNGEINYAVQGIGAFHTPQMTANAEALSGLADANPTAFANTSLAGVPLSAPDFERFSAMQGRMRSGQDNKAQRVQSYNALVSNPLVKQILNAQFGQTADATHPYGDTQPTPGGAFVPSPAHMAYLGALKAEVERAQSGRPNNPLSPQEIGTIAQNLLVSRAGQTHSDGSKIEDFRFIPDSVKNQINAQYQRQFGRPASPDELEYIWHTRR